MALDTTNEIARFIRDAIDVANEDDASAFSGHIGVKIKMVQVKGDDVVITFDNDYRAIMKVTLAFPISK